MTLSTTNNTNSKIDISLSVQVSLAGLSFLARSNNGKTLYYNHIPMSEGSSPSDLLATLKLEVANSGIDSSDVSAVRVVHAVNEYTVVPAHLFDSRKASDFLKFNTRILPGDFIAWDELEGYGANVVYIPLVNINNYLFDTFGSFEYFHSTSILLNILSSIPAQQKAVYAHVKERSYDVVIVSGKDLLLCNSYPYHTPEDFLYYLLFAFEQAGLDPELTPLILMGDLIEEDELFEIAYRYVRNVSLFDEQEDEAVAGQDLSPADFLLKGLLRCV
jgi:hypothetical protein